MSDEFERMLARLDSDDSHIRQDAVDDLQRLFQEQHPPSRGRVTAAHRPQASETARA
jgi:hypothetical protein